MLAAPCYIFSDAHLGFARSDVERTLLGFLGHLRGRAGSLVINGDLFEFWFEWRTVIPRNSYRVLAALADLRDAGIPILLIAGNHDCWGGDVLRRDVGVDYQHGPWQGNVAGWSTRVEHGDGLRGAEDRRYRMVRHVLRHPLAVRVFRWVHPDVGTAIAARSSHASRTYVARDGGRGLRDAAAATLIGNPGLELIVYGHSHVTALERMPSRQVYANPGSWLDAPTYLRVTHDTVSLRRWKGLPEHSDLDAADRVAEEPLAELQKL